jgi:hypothetical protein
LLSASRVSATAYALGASESEVEEELQNCQRLLRARFAETFTAHIVDMIAAEMMDSYRKQLDPPSRAGQ